MSGVFLLSYSEEQHILEMFVTQTQSLFLNFHFGKRLCIYTYVEENVQIKHWVFFKNTGYLQCLLLAAWQ